MARDTNDQKPNQTSEDPAKLGPQADMSASGAVSTDLSKQLQEQAEREKQKAQEQEAARKELEQAETSAAKARVAAEEARAKEQQAGRSSEARAVDEAERKADDELAKVNEARAKLTSSAEGGNTLAEARAIAAPLRGPMLSAGDHMGQKFGNDPENPKAPAGLDVSEKSAQVTLSRITPDSPTPITTSVHRDLVGDYLRAGWTLG